MSKGAKKILVPPVLTVGECRVDDSKSDRAQVNDITPSSSSSSSSSFTNYG